MLKITKGFSLLELMIVVAIIGILVMIAYPSYQMSVMKSRRTEAKTGLLGLAQAQEEYRADNNMYTNKLTMPPLPNVPHDPIKLNGKSVRVDPQFYSFAVEWSADQPLQFKLTATADNAGAQANDTQCQVFTLDQSGQKTAIDKSGNLTTSDCW